MEKTLKYAKLNNKCGSIISSGNEIVINFDTKIRKKIIF